MCHVLPQRKHLSNLNLHAHSACLPPQHKHCCPHTCWPCFPHQSTGLGYLPLLCFGANLTRLTFSLEDATTVALPDECNCLACSFTIVILAAISTARSNVSFDILLSSLGLLRDCDLVPSQMSGKFAWTVYLPTCRRCCFHCLSVHMSRI